MKYFFITFGIVLVVALAPEFASAQGLTTADANLISEEQVTVITYTAGTFAFFFGWIAGSLI